MFWNGMSQSLLIHVEKLPYDLWQSTAGSDRAGTPSAASSVITVAKQVLQ